MPITQRLAVSWLKLRVWIRLFPKRFTCNLRNHYNLKNGSHDLSFLRLMNITLLPDTSILFLWCMHTFPLTKSTKVEHRSYSWNPGRSSIEIWGDRVCNLIKEISLIEKPKVLSNTQHSLPLVRASQYCRHHARAITFSYILKWRCL
jgi:hypothetical protein